MGKESIHLKLVVNRMSHECVYMHIELITNSIYNTSQEIIF